ncbi:unnamed protein product [Urochloa humidicola]
MDGDENASPAVGADEQPVMEFDLLLTMRQVESHRFLAPTRFPPEHSAAYTTVAMLHETMLLDSTLRWLDNLPDGGAAYRNGGFGAVPAAEEVIAALPETTTVGVGDMAERECAVCLEAYEAGDTLRTMPCCSHAFHECCIFQWLRVSRLCPLCRFAMPAAA